MAKNIVGMPVEGFSGWPVIGVGRAPPFPAGKRVVMKQHQLPVKRLGDEIHKIDSIITIL
jgi:hypothetical protein